MSDLKNDSTQAERRAVLKNDRAPTTYHQLAGVDQALEGGGRFGRVEYITGSDPAVQYPRAVGPWADPVRVPDEPPLGFSVNDLEPTGDAAIPTDAEARLAELLPKMIKRRKL